MFGQKGISHKHGLIDAARQAERIICDSQIIREFGTMERGCRTESFPFRLAGSDERTGPRGLLWLGDLRAT